MDTRFLSTFLEVANTRHFGKAAENLYLTQSAVSARIKLLEEYFHTTLFVRHRNSIQLTPAGEKLIPFARSVCETIQQAKQAVQQQSADYIVLGATQLASELFLNQAIAAIKQSYADWTVRAEILTMDSLSRQLHERTIDVALSTEPMKSEEVESSVIRTSGLALYRYTCASQTRTSNSESPTSFAAVDWGMRNRDKISQAMGTTVNPELRTNSLHIASQYLHSKGGCMVLPTNSDLLPTWLTPCIEMLRPLEDTGIDIYVNSLKQVKRNGVAAIRAILTE